ncbi:MAG TPA: DUF1731 domain-containing protein, partial [Nitrososphaeraceae archaeon]|nr:DUF1731 domain-containing protein [Nitrososphaeraceae archaeon]
HTHLFESLGSSSCQLQDHIEYSLPGGPLGGIIARNIVNKKLQKIFDYRHRITGQDIHNHHSVIHKVMKNNKPLTIAITGSSGFIGSSLIPFLTTGGHKVIRLLRRRPNPDESTASVQSIQWNPSSSDSIGLPSSTTADDDNRTVINAVVNLAGENVFGRWTKEKKKRILESRVNTTRSLCKALASLDKPPKILVSASATGYYGDRDNEVLTEDSSTSSTAAAPSSSTTSSSSSSTSPSVNFLSYVSSRWEDATQVAKEAGIRVVNLRIGVVLSASGGILAKILSPFKMGFGGKIGSGNQYISWIALDDLLGIILHVIADDSLIGPINAVAPNPVSNSDFTKILGKVLSRPAIFSIPKFIIKAALGEELADAVLLPSTRVMPIRLTKTSGYQFRFPYLELALRHTLGKSIS